MTTFRKTIETLLRVADDETQTYGRRLAAAVQSAAVLASEINDCLRGSRDVASQHEQVAATLPTRAGGSSVYHGHTARNHSMRSYQGSVVSTQTITDLTVARAHAVLLNQRMSLLDQFAASFRETRERLLAMVADRRNVQQTRLASMLLATEPHAKWVGTKTDYDHIAGIHGQMIARCGGGWHRRPAGPGAAITDRVTFETRGKLGRVGRAAGERLWMEPRRHESSDHLRPSVTIRCALESMERIGGNAVESMREAVETWAVNRRGGWSGVYPDRRLSEQGEALIRCVLSIRRRGITRNRAAAARRLVDRLVASPSGAAGRALAVPEPVGVIRREAVEYSVLRWRVLLADGRDSFEYGLAHHDSPAAECVPDHTQTVHLSTVDDASAIETLTERLASAERQAEWRRSERRSAAERQMMQRQRTAKLARLLLTIPRVTIQDSYAVGNCRPGTAEFCERIGVREKSLSGPELCRRWREAGWPDNSLFARCVESLADAV